MPSCAISTFSVDRELVLVRIVLCYLHAEGRLFEFHFECKCLSVSTGAFRESPFNFTIPFLLHVSGLGLLYRFNSYSVCRTFSKHFDVGVVWIIFIIFLNPSKPRFYCVYQEL